MASSFGSDNHAGIHPRVLAAIAAENTGHAPAYGDDDASARLAAVVRGHFGAGAQTYPMLTGTGANVTALMAMLPRWGAAICAKSAHAATDEAGAPEKMGGIKLLTIDSPDAKLTPELVDQEAWGWGDVHRAQPLVVTITQSTELGTVYTPDEVAALATHAHARGMALHMDGARLANAAATLGVPLRAFTTDAGVDVLSLGGTKNGAMGAEAVVVLSPDPGSTPGLGEAVNYLRKVNAQLASKMRFVSAQLEALYDGDLWLRNASHANAMATRLRARLDLAAAAGRLPGLAFSQATESNAIFATLPDGIADALRADFSFYDWDAARGEVRWMFAFDTAEADVDAFGDAIEAAFA